MSSQFENKVVLITGAAGGLGLAIARRFLAEGANVVAFDCDEQKLQEAYTSSASVYVVGDVRSIHDNERAVALAETRFGRLDVLIANAGIYDNRKMFSSFSMAELNDAFDELFSINVKGYMLAARAATDALKRSRGSIIFTSSVSGNHAGFGGALYVAAKHAINGLTKQLALELAPEVKVSAVAPGYIPTDLKGLDSLAQGRNSVAPKPENLPLGVIATPDDYAAAYVFLASDAASNMASGGIMALDGGSAIRGPRL